MLEVCLPALKLPTSLCANENAIVDELASLWWSNEKLKLANQVRLCLETHFISDLILPDTNWIKRHFEQGSIDKTTYVMCSWPVIQPSKNSFSICKQAIANMSNNDGTLQQLIR